MRTQHLNLLRRPLAAAIALVSMVGVGGRLVAGARIWRPEMARAVPPMSCETTPAMRSHSSRGTAPAVIARGHRAVLAYRL